jgi:hypothetical protein
VISQEAITALLGVALGGGLGYVGSAALQRARFRREDLNAMQERLGIARALHAELRESHIQVQASLDERKMTRSTLFNVTMWRSHGDRLVAALTRSQQDILVNAFARLSMTSSTLAGYPSGKVQIAAIPGREGIGMRS